MRTKLTPENISTFIASLTENANVTLACAVIGCSRAQAYEVRSQDEDFRSRWDEAIEASTDALAQEAYRRATKGVSEPVFYQGTQCGAIQRYSDTLAIFLLKSHRPEIYRETIRQEIDVSRLSDEELQNLAALVPKLTEKGE